MTNNDDIFLKKLDLINIIDHTNNRSTDILNTWKTLKFKTFSTPNLLQSPLQIEQFYLSLSHLHTGMQFTHPFISTAIIQKSLSRVNNYFSTVQTNNNNYIEILGRVFIKK